MAMTEKGVTTTNTPGQEQFETFERDKKTYVAYDYRHTDGELFTCIRTTLEACRADRDAWLAAKKDGKL